MWNLTKALGEAPPQKEAGPLKYRGRLCLTNKSKAVAFNQEYAETSKGVSDRDYRRERVTAARRLASYTTDGENFGNDITMSELESAIKRMKGRKAAGPDGLASDYIKKLTKRAKEQFLIVTNHSWKERWVPQDWRVATIVPILKKGKSPENVNSYRPIALLANLGKIMERVVADRLSWWLEDESAISDNQAGFRRGRSTTDQCLRLSQKISDGFQSKPPLRTAMVLFDYTKAFDTVWRAALMSKMMDMGVPAAIVNWIKAWLTNRLAAVRVGDTHSRKRVYREGLPQGAVLSPLLFTIYVNDLEKFSEGTLVSAFADDLAIACSHTKKETALEAAQAETDVVVEWSRRWRLTLNVGKCETCIFTTSAQERSWQPTVRVGGGEATFNPTPTFLGVKYDPQLSFGLHAEAVTKRMKSRGGALTRLGGATWGWSKESVRTIYQATQRSIAEYAAPAWAPWISKSNANKLERAQLSAARQITGNVRSTPVQIVLQEAGLPPIAERHVVSSLSLYDKWTNLEPGGHRGETTRALANHRTKRSSCNIDG